MGLIQKKEEEREVIEGIEIIESSDTPNDLPTSEVDLVAGKSAEQIAARKDEDAQGAQDAQEQQEPANEAQPVADTAKTSEDTSSKDEKKPAQKNKSVQKEQGDQEKTCGCGSKHHNGSGSGNGCGCGRKKIIALVVAIVIVIVAGIVGYFIGSGGSFGSRGIGAAAFSEDKLDTVVGSYTYNGATSTITAREAIEAQYSLDTAKKDDGTYDTPSATTVLNLARNNVLLKEAETRGISVSEKEMNSFAEDRLGTSDYSTLATQYGVSEDQAKKIVKENATLDKLEKEVVPEIATTAPSEPTAAAEGQENTATEDYAKYIIELAGKEWDADKGTWASEDSTIAKALSSAGITFDGKTATYAAAEAAYNAAYQAYTTTMSSASTKWVEFENDLFSKANITLYGMNV